MCFRIKDENQFKKYLKKKDIPSFLGYLIERQKSPSEFISNEEFIFCFEKILKELREGKENYVGTSKFGFKKGLDYLLGKSKKRIKKKDLPHTSSEALDYTLRSDSYGIVTKERTDTGLTRMSIDIYERNKRRFPRRSISLDHFYYQKAFLSRKESEISKELEISLEEVYTFVDFLALKEQEGMRYCIPIEEIPIEKGKRNYLISLFSRPKANDEFRLFRFKDNIYCTDFSMFKNRLIEFVITILQENEKGWGRALEKKEYISDFLEKMIALKFSTYTNAKVFRKCLLDGNEVDVAVLYESMIIIVEAKANQFSFESMENDKKNQILRNIKEARDQLNKRVKNINEQYCLQEESGEKHFFSCFYTCPLIVTLEDILDYKDEYFRQSCIKQKKCPPIVLCLDEFCEIINRCSSLFELFSFLVNEQLNKNILSNHSRSTLYDFLVFDNIIPDLDYSFIVESQIRDRIYSQNFKQSTMDGFSLVIKSNFQSLRVRDLIIGTINKKEYLASLFIFFYHQLTAVNNLEELFSITFRAASGETLRFKYLGEKTGKEDVTIYYDSKPDFCEVKFGEDLKNEFKSKD